MSHRQELILKRDLLDKNAECIEEQGTSPPQNQRQKKPQNQTPTIHLLRNSLRNNYFFFPLRIHPFTHYARLIWTTRVRHLLL